MDDRRFAELCELMLDGELTVGDAAELRRHVAGSPAALAALHAAARDHVLCRTALRPADPALLAARTRSLLDSWRPASGQVAAQAVFAQLDRRRRWVLMGRWSGLAAAALLLILLVPQVRQVLLRPALAPDPRSPVLQEVHGDVRLGSGLKLANDELIGVNAEVSSGPTGQAILTYPDGTRIALAADTRVVRLPGLTTRLALHQGTVAVTAAHRPADQALEIVCPDAVARVVGTAFSVSVDGGHSRLVVSEGLVRWQRAGDGAWSLVGPGQQVEASALPLVRAHLLGNEQLAAVRAALAAGREPWAGSWASLRAQAVPWRTSPPDEPGVIDVPAFGSPGPGHTRARMLLFQLTKPLIGLALVARLGDDAGAAAGASARLRALTRVALTGAHADVLACDMLCVYGLQAADLLRSLPGWSTADTERIEHWIASDLVPPALRLAQVASVTARLRGLLALITIAAWHGDQVAVRGRMAEVRASIAEKLSPQELDAMLAAPEGDQQVFQSLTHALLCADIARVAADDDTPPPAAWTQALGLYLRTFPSLTPENQTSFFYRALAGPAPWRSPAAAQRFAGADPPQATYGWYFPTLMAHDPRWDEVAGSR